MPGRKLSTALTVCILLVCFFVSLSYIYNPFIIAADEQFEEGTDKTFTVIHDESATKVTRYAISRCFQVNDPTKLFPLLGSNFHCYPIVTHSVVNLVDLKRAKYANLKYFKLVFDVFRMELRVTKTFDGLSISSFNEATLVTEQREHDIKYWKAKLEGSYWYDTEKSEGSPWIFVLLVKYSDNTVRRVKSQYDYAGILVFAIDLKTLTYRVKGKDGGHGYLQVLQMIQDETLTLEEAQTRVDALCQVVMGTSDFSDNGGTMKPFDDDGECYACSEEQKPAMKRIRKDWFKEQLDERDLSAVHLIDYIKQVSTVPLTIPNQIESLLIIELQNPRGDPIRLLTTWSTDYLTWEEVYAKFKLVRSSSSSGSTDKVHAFFIALITAVCQFPVSPKSARFGSILTTPQFNELFGSDSDIDE